jgi:hypothetical protein
LKGLLGEVRETRRIRRWIGQNFYKFLPEVRVQMQQNLSVLQNNQDDKQVERLRKCRAGQGLFCY